MAEQKRKTQAEKAASSSKQKKGSAAGKSSTDKNKKTVSQTAPAERLVATRYIVAVVCLALFVLFLVISLGSEGALLTLCETLALGLLGKGGFIVSIPALLYMFFILCFSGKRPVRMRCFCLAAFVVLVGAVTHVASDSGYMAGGLDIIGDLYQGGLNGNTGGVICGGFAMILQWLCGTILTYILLILGAVLTLLGGMQITIPSIIRAVKNRPRADWEDEELVEKPEPASVVVNHLATKRIEHVEKRRLKAERDSQIQLPEVTVIQETKTAPVMAVEPPKASKPAKTEKAIPQIDVDVDSPVVSSAPEKKEPVPEKEPEILIPQAKEKAKEPKIQPVKLEKVPEKMPELITDIPVDDPVVEAPPAELKKEKVTAKDAAVSAAQVAAEIAAAEAEPKAEYCYPPIDLLKLPAGGKADGTAEMKENTRRLNETLACFKIDAHIINVTRGPSVTRYEVELEKGVRLNKLTTVADDIALSLGAVSVRIAPVPGKISVVGIEVPNRTVTTVSLREVIDSDDFAKAKSKSSFAVGKDIGGNCIVGNIAKLPHMLIAGTTGSGKSVCMNSIIISLLYKASPEDVKLIMVDPKMVELGIYNDIPHLLIPVVTDPKKAAGSLQWAVTEMMRRYKAMSDAGVRDLESYNSIVQSEEDGQKLPQVVVIIDELADLMLVAAKEVEESICRIAQMGRAAGIHLVIATQRPSADVITGLMKANIPSRIAFAVASAMESRIILDTQGAEKLVGRGDMLFAPIGTGKPQRVQGCFVSDTEVEAVANYVKKNYQSTYDQTVMEEIEKKAQQTGNSKAAAAAAEPEPTAEELDGDEMLPAAVDVILETGQASVSMLQRRLKLGYARAARIVDEMEEKGIVGPFQGSKPRTILITKEQWASMKGGGSEQMEFADLMEAEVSEETEEE